MNTRFFFTRELETKKSKNHIKGLSNGAGSWLIDDRGTKITILNYFEDIFRAGPLGGGDVL